MGLFSRFNKSQVFSNVNTNDFTYINPKDLYEELKDTPIKVAGVFINNKSSKYGAQAVAILPEYKKLLNLPSYMVIEVEEILKNEDMIKEIKDGKVSISLSTYTNQFSKQQDGSEKVFYSVTWID